MITLINYITEEVITSTTSIKKTPNNQQTNDQDLSNNSAQEIIARNQDGPNKKLMTNNITNSINKQNLNSYGQFSNRNGDNNINQARNNSSSKIKTPTRSIPTRIGTPVVQTTI